MRDTTPTIAIALTLVLGMTACAPGETGPGLPNIVIVVADDLGRRDVSFHGGVLPTPNIDRIAREGVALERFYSAPVCSPTRAGLLTGRYPIRYGLMRSVIPPWRDYGLDTDEVLLPELLAEAGYAERGIFGKWHLGHTSVRYHPLRRGFTEFVGHYNGGIDYFVHEREGERDWQHGYTSVDEHGYSTDLLTDYAVDFIARHAAGEAPFLLYVPYNAVHSPWQAREGILPRYADLPGIDLPPGHQESNEDILGYVGDAEGRREKRRITAAMGESLDTGVGRILDALDERGIADNTFVLFFSDNGGVVGVSDNTPFRGAKASVYEGGIRVAAAARWPAGGISGGGEVSAPVAYIDVLPTLLGIVGMAAPNERALDGRDVLGVLAGTEEDAPRDLYSYVAVGSGAFEQVAVIEPEWKLVVVGPELAEPGAAERSRMLLYAIATDPHELEDLSAEHPDVVSRMLEKAVAFRALQPADAVPPYNAGREGFVPPPDWKAPDLP